MKLTSKYTILGSAVLLCLGMAGCAGKEPSTSPQAIEEEAQESAEAIALGYEQAPQTARAELVGRDGNSVGEVTFTQTENGATVKATVHGVTPPGLHGIHVHEVGDCSASDFSSAGGHFNPAGAPHACPPDPSRHVGDLGNITVDGDGNGTLDLSTGMNMFGNDPSQSIVNRAVILHAGEDDCTSQPSGDSGERIACGVIELVAGEGE